MQKLSNNIKLLNKLLKNGINIIDPDTVYIEGKIKIGEGTIVYPNVYLIDSIIGINCIIGPTVQIVESKIGKDVYVGFTAQIKRSRIGDGVHMAHHGYLGDAIVGKNVNVGAGFIICNYDGKEKHQTIIEDDVFLGSNSTVIAPNKIGRGCFIAAGSVIPANTHVGKNNLVISREKKIILKKINNSKI
jgi:bifunctional UDP-N-acetylglucosamine pyrophosphorylase / glucosamine-1-phosphate N-acetyltransferase